MRFTIIMNMNSNYKCIKYLHDLKNYPPIDELEIIYIDDDFDNYLELSQNLPEKFFDIKYINRNSKNKLYSSLIRATGDYVLLTDSADLLNMKTLDKRIFKNFYKKILNNDTESLIYTDRTSSNNKTINKNLLIISLNSYNYDFIYYSDSDSYNSENNDVKKGYSYKLEALIDSQNNIINYRSSDLKTLEFSVDELFNITQELCNIPDLFESRSNESIYIENEAVNLTHKILANTSLTYDEFKVFVDKTFNYYVDYQKDRDKDDYCEINRFILSLIKCDYLDAFKEYKQLNKRVLDLLSTSDKFISIIIDVYDEDLLRIGLENLFNNSIFDLEIICVDYSDCDLRRTTESFKDKFYNIKIIDSRTELYSFNREISEANGIYTLFTKLNNLISNDYINNLNHIITDTYKNHYNLTLFNFKKFRNELCNILLNDLPEKVLDPNNLTIEELSIIYQFDCDKIISNKFFIIENDSKLKQLSFEPITYLDLLIRSKNIYLINTQQEEKNLEKLKTSYDYNQNQKAEIIYRIESLKSDIPFKINEDEVITCNNSTVKIHEPKISIIIPVYNPEKKDIQKLMINLLKQTLNFNDLELIFVDSQSENKEGIKLIIQYTREYHNIKLYYTPPNSSSAIACNIGLNNAKGKFIMFLDVFYYYLSNAFEILYNTITQEDDIQIVHGNYIRPNWSYDRLDWKRIGINDYKNVATTIDEKYKYMRLGSSVLHMIFRKEFLDQENIRFKDYKISYDTLFHDTCLLKDSKTVFINEPIVFYENSEVSKTLEPNLEKLLTQLEIRYEISKLYDSYAPEYKYVVLNDVIFLSNFLLNTLLNFKEFKEYVDNSYQFYADYLKNTHTIEYPKIRSLCKAIANKDYLLAYREYTKQIDLEEMIHSKN